MSNAYSSSIIDWGEVRRCEKMKSEQPPTAPIRKNSLEILKEKEAELKQTVEIFRKQKEECDQREREKKEARQRIALLEKEISSLSIRKNNGTFALSDDEEGDVIIPPASSSDRAGAF